MGAGKSVSVGQWIGRGQWRRVEEYKLGYSPLQISGCYSAQSSVSLGSSTCGIDWEKSCLQFGKKHFNIILKRTVT